MAIVIYNLNGTGTEIPAINVASINTEYIIQGTAVAVGNYAISYTGTPNVTSQINISYRGNLDITTNSTTFTLLGQAYNQNDLSRELEITARWTGSTWKVITKKDFKEAGIIEASHLSSNSVTTAAIADGSVTEPKLATNSVSTIKIQDDAVTAAKLNADVAGLGLVQAISGALDVNVDDSTLEISTDTLQIKNDGVTTLKVLDSAITTPKISDLAVTTAKVNDGAIVTAKVSDNQITNAKLAQMGSLTVKGNITGGTANAADVPISSLFSNDATKWSLTGNAGTTPGTNFLGTTDNQDLWLKVNNIKAAYINSSGLTNNLSFGKAALISITNGVANVAIGDSSLGSNTTGSYNVSVGSFALNSNTTGELNTAYGHQALDRNTTGYRNVAIGAFSAHEITTGYSNICIGNDSGIDLTTGNSNICIGELARPTQNNAVNTISIGVGATADVNNQFALHNSITNMKLRGINYTLPPNDGIDKMVLQTNGTGQLTFSTVIDSGIYTPTLTNTTNITSSTAFICTYTRIGAIVTVTGRFNITATSTAPVLLGISLPIASNLSNTYELTGTSVSEVLGNDKAGFIIGNTVDNRASFQTYAGDTNSNAWYFSFTYRVI